MIEALTGHRINVRHRDIVAGHNAVELIMRQLGLRGLPTRRLP